MEKKDKEQQRPEAYPKPTETDQQMQNQDEFIEEHANYNDQEPRPTTSRKQDRGISERTNNTIGNP